MDARFIIQKSIQEITASQILFSIIAFLSFLFIFFLNNSNEYLVLIKNFVLSVLIFYSIIHVVFIKAIEKKLLKATLESLTIEISKFSKNYSGF